ncbi:DUF2190 family protein [Morganella morganii]|uniref:DUF2190 family protein n=1 Tax=Morganella morganii TaxID=582 RepID=UPI002023B824|nr:capsid cement protein [Morganella morganii]
MPENQVTVNIRMYMAKNYQQSGGMIEVSNKGTDVIKSGSIVIVGTLAAVVIADIPAGETGDGFAEGVFRLPKKGGFSLKAGTVAMVKDGVLTDTGGTTIGVVWGDAADSAPAAAVKINMFLPGTLKDG